MARIQILELPMTHVGEVSETPFVLVIDETQPERHILGPGQAVPESAWERFGRQVGARGVLITSETIDIPANCAAIPGAAGTPEAAPWVIRMVAALQQYEDEHAGDATCLKAALDQVPDGIQQLVSGGPDA